MRVRRKLTRRLEVRDRHAVIVPQGVGDAEQLWAGYESGVTPLLSACYVQQVGPVCYACFQNGMTCSCL